MAAIYGFQTNGTASASSVVTLSPGLVDLSSAFTLCLWLQVHFVNRPKSSKAIATAFSVATREQPNSFFLGREKQKGMPLILDSLTCLCGTTLYGLLNC